MTNAKKADILSKNFVRNPMDHLKKTDLLTKVRVFINTNPDLEMLKSGIS